LPVPLPVIGAGEGGRNTKERIGMKVGDISKAVGKTVKVVAEELGIESGRGVVMKQVDEAQAQAYIAANGGDGAGAVSEQEPEQPKPESKPSKCRFWCEIRRNTLPSRRDEKRGDIKIREWHYECEGDSPEAAFLRRVDIRDRLRIYEVLQKPYADDERRLKFARFVEGLIYTGESRRDGPSREGRLKAMALLFAGMEDALPKAAKNVPEQVALAIAARVSLDVDSFGLGE